MRLEMLQKNTQYLYEFLVQAIPSNSKTFLKRVDWEMI